MNIRVNLLELKKAVDKMVYDYEHRIDAMSDRITIVAGNNEVYFRQACMYAECLPNVQSIKTIE